jgi:hypothetical protein
MEIPRPERPHGALGAVSARRHLTTSVDSPLTTRPKVTPPSVETPTKPSRKKSIYASRPHPAVAR